MKELIVIGNGFDIALKLKSKYSDFFESDQYKKYKETVFNKINNIDLYENADADITCWDLLFYYVSKNDSNSVNDINWCDIELVIYDSLTNANSEYLYWENVFYHIDLSLKHTSSMINHNFTRFMVIYLKKNVVWSNQNFSRKTFYSFLLKELNDFEKRFGKYIHDISNDRQLRITASEKLNGIAHYTHYYTDSFNYSFWGDKNNTKNYRHINGDVDNPIFGIDVSSKEILKSIPELIMFTKTYRRMQQEATGVLSSNSKDGINLVKVFGHSLNEQDYDYYVYIFTMLKFNTFDVEQMGKIEFLYNVYDEEHSIEISNKCTDAVYKLLNYYESLVRNDDQTVLINLLRFSGKLEIKSIDFDNIDSNQKSHTVVSY